MSVRVVCGGCGNVLVEGADAYPDDLGPCGACDSPLKEVSIDVEDNFRMYEQVRSKAKGEGGGKPFLETIAGDDLHRKTGKWNKLTRVIDRRNDRYYELVRNPDTGEVIRECEEPLSHHIGRGSARYQEHGFPHEEIAYGAFCVYEEERRAGKYSGADSHWFTAIERLRRVRAGLPYTA